MILYQLKCANSHSFESWFPDSASFDDQKKRSLIHCPFCETTEIEKALMTPHISKGKKSLLPVSPSPLEKLQRYIKENYHYVGSQFAEEARKIHYGEQEKMNIYGEATSLEIQELLEEDIMVLPLPELKQTN